VVSKKRKMLNMLEVYTSTETGEDTSGDEVGERPQRKL
jgi:hypothetical protein